MNNEMIGEWNILMRTNCYFIATKEDYAIIVATEEGERNLFEDHGIRHYLFHTAEGPLLCSLSQAEPGDYNDAYDLVLTDRRIKRCVWNSDQRIHS